MKFSAAIVGMVIWFIAGILLTLIVIGPLRLTVNLSPLGAFTDFTFNCRYVVADVTDDGLHIEIKGEPHCRDRIHIDGTKITPERKT